MKSVPEIRELHFSDEFRPRAYKVRIFNLRDFGVPQVPVVGHVVHNRVDKRLPWHFHNGCFEFIYCAAGACEYESDGRAYRFTPGMMFVSRPCELHRQLGCPKGHATFVMQFKPSADETTRWFADRFSELPKLFSCSRSVPVHFVKILALAEDGDGSLGTRIRIQTLIRMLWLDILGSTSLPTIQRIPRVFDEIAERMRIHPEQSYPLDDLVKESGMSKASFITLFKKAHGITPHSYLLRCRVDEAKRMLESGLSVKAAADRFGFLSPQHFSRTFRNFVGKTPSMWLDGKKA